MVLRLKKIQAHFLISRWSGYSAWSRKVTFNFTEIERGEEGRQTVRFFPAFLKHCLYGIYHMQCFHNSLISSVFSNYYEKGKLLIFFVIIFG